jgi:hypothetical protein
VLPALPQQSPAQSIEILISIPVLPPVHSSQLSNIAVPKHSLLQSKFRLNATSVFPKVQTPQSSTTAVPQLIPSQLSGESIAHSPLQSITPRPGPAESPLQFPHKS